MAQITTTLVVNFNAGAASARGVLQAEIDSRADGLNNGNTSFGPGDQPGFLIYKSTNVTLDSVTPSAGAIQNAGTFDVVIEETVQFAKSATASVSKPIKNLVLTSFKWLGTDLGTPSVTDETTISAPGGSTGVGVLKITYVAQAIGRRLTGISVPGPTPAANESSFPVLILIEGTGP